MNAQGLPHPPPGAPRHCPDCAAALSADARACQRCGLILVGPTAQRLWWIDTELEALRGRERTLSQERPLILGQLRQESQGHARREEREQRDAAHESPGSVSASVPGQAPNQAPPAAPLTAPGAVSSGRSGEVSPRSAQNAILGLGGLLVGIAAVVFAIWTWSDMSTGTRAAVLGLTTLTFAGLALPLYRRGLRATAETIGAVAAGLLCVDALALWTLTDQITNGPGYTAAALALMGAVLLLYSTLVPLRSPRVLAVVLVQPVPVLLAVALPTDSSPSWLLAALAATALADALVLRRLGAPRPGVPVRTLKVAGLILWGLTVSVTVFAVLVSTSYPGDDPLSWWSLASALFLAGVAALLLERWRRPAPSGPEPHAPRPITVHTVLGLGTLILAPLIAGPAHLPALPRLTVLPWSLDPDAMTTPAVELLQLDRASTLPPLSFVYLAGVLVAATLVVCAVWLLRRSALLLTVSLVAPATLLALPLLLGLPQVVAAVWALVVGGGLVLGSALLNGWTRAIPVITGALTLLTGLTWALPERYTTLAAILMLAVTALVCAAGARRFTDPVRRPEPGDRAATLYGGSTLLWGLSLLVGTAYVIGNRGADDTVQAQWWLLTASVVLCGATALMLGRVPAPASRRGSARDFQAITNPRRTFTLAGLALLPVAPLLAVPENTPALALLAERPPWSAPVQSMWEPVHAVLGLPAQPSAPLAVGSALGVLLVGALVAGLVSVIDRRWLTAALSLTVPTTLVPLPVLLGAPFLAALVWTLAVGALLLTGAALLRENRLSWMPWLTGLTTLALALSWAVSERFSTVAVLLAVAALASAVTALARTGFVTIASTSVATAATGAFALVLPLALDVPVEYAVFGPIVVTTAVAVVAPRLRGPLVKATEIPAAAWAVLSLLLTTLHGGRLELVAVTLAVVGVVSLASAVRPNRRWFAVVGGVLMFLALWTALASWNVTVPEAYTVPPAIAFLVIGWEWSRRAAEPPPSWLAYGGGLTLLLGSTVWRVLTTDDMVWRLPAVLVVGLAVTVWGLRQRIQAALVIGGLTLLGTSLRAFGPPLWELTQLMPNWLPFAVVGVLLLFVGARYEASLARLRQVSRLLSEMR